MSQKYFQLPTLGLFCVEMGISEERYDGVSYKKIMETFDWFAEKIFWDCCEVEREVLKPVVAKKLAFGLYEVVKDLSTEVHSNFEVLSYGEEYYISELCHFAVVAPLTKNVYNTFYLLCPFDPRNGLMRETFKFGLIVQK